MIEITLPIVAAVVALVGLALSIFRAKQSINEVKDQHEKSLIFSRGLSTRHSDIKPKTHFLAKRRSESILHHMLKNEFSDSKRASAALFFSNYIDNNSILIFPVAVADTRDTETQSSLMKEHVNLLHSLYGSAQVHEHRDFQFSIVSTEQEILDSPDYKRYPEEGVDKILLRFKYSTHFSSESKRSIGFLSLIVARLDRVKSYDPHTLKEFAEYSAKLYASHLLD